MRTLILFAVTLLSTHLHGMDVGLIPDGERRVLVAEIVTLLSRQVQATNTEDKELFATTIHQSSPAFGPSLETFVSNASRYDIRTSLVEWAVVGHTVDRLTIISATTETIPTGNVRAFEPFRNTMMHVLRRNDDRSLRIWSSAPIAQEPIKLSDSILYPFHNPHLRTVAKRHFLVGKRPPMYQIGYMDGLLIADQFQGVIPQAIWDELEADNAFDGDMGQGVLQGMRDGVNGYEEQPVPSEESNHE